MSLNSIAVGLDVSAFRLMSPEIGGKFEPADSLPQWLSECSLISYFFIPVVCGIVTYPELQGDGLHVPLSLDCFARLCCPLDNLSESYSSPILSSPLSN